MRVLIACEFSGIVREAFAKRACDAWSCDLLPTEQPGQHLQCNVEDVLKHGWDLMIAHPPCTHLAISGARWFEARQAQQLEAIAFVEMLWASSTPKIAIENPIGVLSTRSCLGKPSQIIQPWQFGHMESKATCLWLKGLPLLEPSKDVSEAMQMLPLKQRTRIHYAAPGPQRWKQRSRTLQGIADAMAEQWSNL